jgi:hypothetical protein
VNAKLTLQASTVACLIRRDYGMATVGTEVITVAKTRSKKMVTSLVIAATVWGQSRQKVGKSRELLWMT